MGGWVGAWGLNSGRGGQARAGKGQAGWVGGVGAMVLGQSVPAPWWFSSVGQLPQWGPGQAVRHAQSCHNFPQVLLPNSILHAT